MFCLRARRKVGFEDEAWRIRYSAGTNFIHWCSFICWIHFFSEWCTGSDKRVRLYWHTVHSGLTVYIFHILRHLLYRFAEGSQWVTTKLSIPYWCRLHPGESFHMPFLSVLQVLEETDNLTSTWSWHAWLYKEYTLPYVIGPCFSSIFFFMTIIEVQWSETFLLILRFLCFVTSKIGLRREMKIANSYGKIDVY